MANSPAPPPPVVVIITGPSATGKTTLARELAGRLRLPLLSKDTIKEGLGDVLGCADVDQSRRLGQASMLLLYRFLEALLAAGQSCIIESNFHIEYSTRDLQALQQRQAFIPLQILCCCDPAVQRLRWEQRLQSGERHPVHLDRQRDEPSSRSENMPHCLPIGGDRLDIDTTYAGAAEYAQLARRISERISALRWQAAR